MHVPSGAALQKAEAPIFFSEHVACVRMCVHPCALRYNKPGAGHALLPSPNSNDGHCSKPSSRRGG